MFILENGEMERGGWGLRGSERVRERAAGGMCGSGCDRQTEVRGMA